MEVSQLLIDARRSAGLTQAELAVRSGTSQATLCAYETGAKGPTAATLSRILAATGRRLSTRPATAAVRTPSAVELSHRGRILAQVIDLAERLPSRRVATLGYPRLAATQSSRA
ncbi:hypothetical protein BH10ACT11_BH10ACT11_15890 [soil metagenome]